MKEPRFLVQSSDGILHGYWDPLILRCDIRTNKGEEIRLFERVPGILVRYQPISIESFLASKEAS